MLPRIRSQGESIHFRHADISQKQIDTAGIKNVYCFIPIFSNSNLPSLSGKEVIEQVPYQEFIVNYKYRRLGH